MADNEKLDNQRLKNFKNKGRDLECKKSSTDRGSANARYRISTYSFYSYQFCATQSTLFPSCPNHQLYLCSAYK